MALVDDAGNAADIWVKNGRVTRPDGTEFQSRNWKTISTAYQFFAQDTISFMDDKLSINLGLRAPTMTRDFTNTASEETGYNYSTKRASSELLPQLGARFQIDTYNQVFASLAKNMKAPPNFAYSKLKAINGVGQLPVEVKAETSYNFDLGYRHQSDKLTAQVTAYSVDFNDRQATAYDEPTKSSSLTNVGKVKTQGFEVELGNTPINGWSFYGSAGYATSEIKENTLVSQVIKTTGQPDKTVIVSLPTAGKQMALTPEWKLGLSAGYDSAVWYTRLKAKYTSTQQATLVNDEEVPAYTLVGFDAGYQFGNFGWAKKTTLRLSISNLFDKQYRNPSSQNVTNAQAVGVYAGRNVFYYMGSPRLASVTLSADF